MVKLKLKLMRASKYVTLELIEGGRPLVKGRWWRLEHESNCSLKYDSGVWENWALGTPGSVKHIRLYDPSDTKAAVLQDYLAGGIAGPGTIILPEFAGAFGTDEFRWIQVACAAAC